MRPRLSFTLVPVRDATSAALLDMGEQRSPKKLPLRMAPAMRASLVPIALPTAMQTTPVVAAAPKELPIRNDITAQSRKLATTSVAG